MSEFLEFIFASLPEEIHSCATQHDQSPLASAYSALEKREHSFHGLILERVELPSHIATVLRDHLQISHDWTVLRLKDELLVEMSRRLKQEGCFPPIENALLELLNLDGLKAVLLEAGCPGRRIEPLQSVLHPDKLRSLLLECYVSGSSDCLLIDQR